MLSMSQLTAFVRDGFVVVPEVVSESLLAKVDEEFARVMDQQPPAAEGAPHRSAFVPPGMVPACTATFDDSGARVIAESLVEPRPLEHRFDHVQLCTVPGKGPLARRAPHRRHGTRPRAARDLHDARRHLPR